MGKVCSYCRKEKDAEKDFSWEYKSRGIRAPRCKACQAELGKQHYQQNKAAYNGRSRIRKIRVRNENQAKLHAYLMAHPCIDCGQTDITLLEFDHIRGEKISTVSHLLSNGHNWPILEAEIAKCEIRCANCHRKKTFERAGNWWRSMQLEQHPRTSYEQTRIYLLHHPCVDCGEADLRLLEFDHVHGKKTDQISHMLSQGCCWSTISAEVAKCEVRCANCHRKKTFERAGNWWKAEAIEQSAD